MVVVSLIISLLISVGEYIDWRRNQRGWGDAMAGGVVWTHLDCFWFRNCILYKYFFLVDWADMGRFTLSISFNMKVAISST